MQREEATISVQNSDDYLSNLAQCEPFETLVSHIVVVRRIPVIRLLKGDESNFSDVSYQRLVLLCAEFCAGVGLEGIDASVLKFTYIDLDGDQVTVSSSDEFVEGWKHIGQTVFKVTAMTSLSEKVANSIVDEFLNIKQQEKAKGVRECSSSMKGRMEMKKRLIKTAVENVKAEREKEGMDMSDKACVPIMIASEIITLKTPQWFDGNEGPHGAPRMTRKFDKFRVAIENSMDKVDTSGDVDIDLFVDTIVSEIFQLKHQCRGPPHPHGPPHHGHPHGPPHHGPPHHGPPHPYGPPHGHHHGPPHHGPPHPYGPRHGAPHHRGDFHAWRMANWKGTVNLAVKRAFGEAPPVTTNDISASEHSRNECDVTVDRPSDESSFVCVESMDE